jgi:saccharopine dehydrogenase-like NADP-dependent oxidoreductase
MTARVLVVGGYGNFGGTIARALAPDPALRVLVGGRSRAKADAFVAALDAAHAPEAHALDIAADPAAALAQAKPDIAIHTSGPFQGQGYDFARACIARGVHYVDLADGRDFVAGFGALDAAARAANVVAVTGASSVPCLTAAIVDSYLPGFAQFESLDYGISTAQRTARGVATTAAVLGYTGKSFATLRDGRSAASFGFGGLRSVVYPEIGRRFLGDCDIPDLALFPARYKTLRSIRFGAGHELAVLQFATRIFAQIVRLGLVRSPERRTAFILRWLQFFDRFGGDKSGFHMFLAGQGSDGKPKTRRFFIVARAGHGPNIPCVPAILLARRLARAQIAEHGARPCLDLIDLDSYLGELARWDISVHRDPI